MEDKIDNGWISLYRKFVKWQWYKNANIKSVFMHLVLFANHKEENWRGIIVKRGQLITSRETLSDDLGLSIQQIRTCLSKLESTNEIKIETTNRYSLITVINYDKYQKSFTEEVTSKTTKFSTSKNDDISTSKSTSKITSKSTTNNNILINNNNNNNNILLNYTTLNLLFNYLIYKEQKFENLQEKDREAIITILKKLEIYITSIEYIPTNKLLELKIQYWTIMELYLSPYKLYINNLNKLDFMFRFFKTQQYVNYDSEEKLSHFVGYFIKSLREEMKENGNTKSTIINK